jgi:hypothetical protein
MSFLEKMERHFGRFALSNITLYIVIGQAFVFFASMLRILSQGMLLLVPILVLRGQWWRVFTFLIQPPAVSDSLLGYVGLVFGWWIFYFMGSALEGYWGAFRYNLFLIAGWLLTVAVSFLQPAYLVTNMYLGASVFLAFAYVHPDFELMIFYVIPVKIRWIALAAWVYGFVLFMRGDLAVRLQLLAAVGNIFLFFGRDIWLSAGLKRRRMAMKSAARAVDEGQPRHKCRICGVTDLTNPELDFRYCSKCAGDQCYCPEHIFRHEHILSDNEAAKRG